jgi:hypothetical protein
MSDPILPLLQWPAGIQQASVPANDNALRVEALSRPALGTANDESTPADGDVWIVGSAPTGAFSSFDEDDIALYHVDEVSGVGGWHAWAPVEDVRLVVNDTRMVWTGSDGWITDPSVGGGGGGSGDVNGPASSTDNALARFDGTGGKTLQNSVVIVSDSGQISGYLADLNAQTGTTYTLQASDRGKVVELTNGSSITLTLPSTLAVGFCCTIVQGGAGQVNVAAGSGATLRNRQSHTKLAGQWSGATLYVRTNSGGSAAEYVLNGDTAA